MRKKKTRIYDVTLRRDVQLRVDVRVEASTRQEAIAVAEAAIDVNAWSVEENISAHAATVKTATLGAARERRR